MSSTLTQYVSCAQAFLTRNVATIKTQPKVQWSGMNNEELMGKRLRAARLDLSKRLGGKKWSEQMVADEIPGLTRSALGNYENGIRYPGPSVFMKLSEFYKEPAAYLAGLVADEAEVTIARAYFNADAKGRAHILSAAEMTIAAGGGEPEEKRGIERSQFFESKPEKQAEKKKPKPGTSTKRGKQ
jgi:transcriptional regulator with XRE-family HTH domain